MAYFSCMAGVGGKGNSVIVTCDADFAGIPITCTNGQKTYTKVCPSFSPYEVTFTGLVAGTWTISATVDGVVYSTTAIVTDITAVLSYGFNWKMWVDSSSSLHSSDYTDLADLLSDEAAIRQLFTEHAPTDYAASTATVTPDLATVLNNDICAKWINLSDYALDTLYANPLIAAAMDSADKYFYGEWGIVDDTTTPPTWGAKGNVPVMTSDTTPYGTCIKSGVTDNTYAWQAFNRSQTLENCWYHNASPCWLGYKSTNPICLKAFEIQQEKATPAYFNNYKVQGSNDGTTWEDITDVYTEHTGTPGEKYYHVIENNDKYYLYHRFYFPTASSVQTAQFYGRELKVSVPTMTGNTTPYGEASASSVTSGSYQAYRAFDNDEASVWLTNTISAPQFIQYDFTNSVCIKMLVFGARSGNSYQRSVTAHLKASNDGTDFSANLLDFNTPSNGNLLVLAVTNTTSYKYYRVVIDDYNDDMTSVGGAKAIMARHIQFYGLDYSEKEFEEGTTKKWLYDHGVELEEIHDIRSGGVIKEASDIKVYAYITNEAARNGSALIDLTPYSLARMRVPQWQGTLCSILACNPSNINTTLGYTRISSANTPNTLSLDVSAINQQAYIGAQVDTGINDIYFNELWLE